MLKKIWLRQFRRNIKRSLLVWFWSMKSVKDQNLSPHSLERMMSAIAGRKIVWYIPEELIETPMILVGGHHGKLHIQGLRLIIDEGDGSPDKPVAAIVLPPLKIIGDTDFLPTE
ncbi:hypothetical protein NL676_018006 [Syzygium grande]|nr:hypothetical protein NL676_018006 [Syzygium grande]